MLDCETTGLPDRGPVRIVAVAVAELDTGHALMDCLVDPRVPGEVEYPIPPEATAVHGIADADVAGALTWGQVREGLLAILEVGTKVWAYNAEFDRTCLVLHEHDHVRAVRELGGECEPLGGRVKDLHWDCAMSWDADPWQVGELARWRTLRDAARSAGHEWGRHSAHSALGDVLACRSVVLHLKELYERGLPCALCGQQGRPRVAEAPSYCSECWPVLKAMVDAIFAANKGRAWLEDGRGCRKAVAAALDALGVTVPEGYVDAAWACAEAEDANRRAWNAAVRGGSW